MEWSGKFSLEEYLALAQDISAEGTTPDVVTVSSFKRAAHVGCAAVALERRSRRKEETGSTWTEARDTRYLEGDSCVGSVQVSVIYYIYICIYGFVIEGGEIRARPKNP